MTEVVSVRFKSKGKMYYFDPAGITVEKGDSVIVETSKGLEFAECVQGNHNVEDPAVVPPLRCVIRIATDEDKARAEENHKREAEALEICREKIEKHGLDMKLVDVEYNFEGNKILFFFTSDGRVDFRELVKDLATVFKTRIELRQIGVRDEARMLGGLGICGKPFCCAQFLEDFEPVSIKMAKTQGLSLNPTKISGTCGRLMCCLKYEQEAYEDLVKNVPKVDAFVDTPQGKGSVVDVNLLRAKVRVRLEDQHDTALKTFEASEVTVLGGKAKRAEYLAMKAQGLIEEEKPAPKFVREKKRPVKQVPEREEQPELQAEQSAQPEAEVRAEQPKRDGKRRRRQRGKGGHSEQPKQEVKPQEEKPQEKPQNAEHHHKGGGKHRGGKGGHQKHTQEASKTQSETAQGAGGENPQNSGHSGTKRHRPRHRRPFGGDKQSGGAPKAE